MSKWITPRQQFELGWDIFPILGGRKTTYAHYLPNGKTVPTYWVQGWERLTAEQVAAFWPGDGRHNIGVATGHRSGVWVLDVDKVFEDEEDAREYVAEITGITFPETLSVRTASGKWHFYFKMPDNPAIEVKSSVDELGKAIDVRGDGGMAMGICSSVVDENGYRDFYTVVNRVKPVYAPLELLERVKRKERAPRESAVASVEKDVDPVADEFAQRWIEEELQKLRDLPRPWHEGANWHNTCFEVACQVMEFANSPWCSTTPDEMEERYLDAAPGPERDWDPAKEWSEGVKKTEGQGRAKPRASMPTPSDAWFVPTVTETEVLPIPEGEKYGPPHTWVGKEFLIDQVQDSGATFRLAFAIREILPKAAGRPILASYDGAWHYYEGSYWAEAEPEEVVDFVSRNISLVCVPKKGEDGEMKLSPLSPSMGKVRDVAEALATMLRVSTREQRRDDDALVVYMANGSLTIDGDKRIHVGPTPSAFNLSALPFAYDPTARCPQWEAFLIDLFEHDPDSIVALQEWFGYFLVGNPGWLQKMFWLIGPKRSGKGTILHVARMLMGEAATATSLTMLSKDFGRENLIGKNLAIIDDARDPDPRLAHSVVEFLLTLSSGGFTTVARKHRRNWDGALSSNLFAASNTVPYMPDDGGAVSSRLEIIRTKKSFFGHEDTRLGERLATELPGILNWALVGLDRLRVQQRFTQSSEASEVRDEVDRGATGATPMVRDLLMLAPTPRQGVAKKDLGTAADWWAQQQEDSWRPNRVSISKAIRAEFPEARDNQRAERPDGTPIRSAWRGIVLRCRECDSPATRILMMNGPECELHLSTVGYRTPVDL